MISHYMMTYELPAFERTIDQVRIYIHLAGDHEITSLQLIAGELGIELSDARELLQE